MIHKKFTRAAGCSVLTLCLFFTAIRAQIPSPALVGYWQNYNDPNAPYVQLNNMDPRYNVIEVSFAVPHAGTDYQMEFIPNGNTMAELITQIQGLQAQGKKIIISIGGGNSPVTLDDASEKNTFISTMNAIIDQYGFDGIDIDLEGSSISVAAGSTIAAPGTKVDNLIDAIKQIMQHHRTVKPGKLLLTMAPETVFVQGGMSGYGNFGGAAGAHLPVIQALRDSIDLLQVQLYNSGSMYGIDGGIYTQASVDFIVAMTEAVIKGFSTTGGMYTGLPASKVAVGLPACGNAAPGGGYTDPAIVRAAMKYLMGSGPRPGNYTLQQVGGYPSLRGMMTWSINWDKVATCAGVYEYASNFQTIFFGVLPVTMSDFTGTYNISGNILKWVTTSQLNTAYFVIEKSKDGVSFDSRDTTKVAHSNSPASYSYTDPDAAGVNYYRLKITDLNGQFIYSPVISITSKNVYTLSVYPNPAKDYVRIRSGEVMNNATIKITDVNGRIVQPATRFSGTAAEVNIASLPGGLYIIELYNSEKRYQSRVIKE